MTIDATSDKPPFMVDHKLIAVINLKVNRFQNTYLLLLFRSRRLSDVGVHFSVNKKKFQHGHLGQAYHHSQIVFK